MDQPTVKTAGSYSTFVAMCSDLEERVIDQVPDGAQRETLLDRVRGLRTTFESWPCVPPTRQMRSQSWMELCGLEETTRRASSFPGPNND